MHQGGGQVVHSGAFWLRIGHPRQQLRKGAGLLPDIHKVMTFSGAADQSVPDTGLFEPECVFVKIADGQVIVVTLAHTPGVYF